MNIGFTGTREGLSEAQATALRELFDLRGKPDEFHHGACLGADEQATSIATMLWKGVFHCHAHPSDLRGMTSQVALDLSDEVSQPLPPLDRNRRIVDACDFLIACPLEETEQRRSGTWATIRYARTKKVEVVIVTRDGYYIGEEVA